MKCIILLSALVFLAAADLYSTENDDLDIESVVNDPEMLKTFLDCFNDKGVCDDIMEDFKKDIPEAVAENCAKCTEAQKHIFKRFLEVIKVKQPEGYEVFKQKYDPQDKHMAALESAIANS